MDVPTPKPEQPSIHQRRFSNPRQEALLPLRQGAHDYGQSGAAARARGIAPTPSPWKAAIGQALVKQSFIPVQVPAGQEPARLVNDPADRSYPDEYTRDERGTFYRTGDPAALFIMLKTDPATPGTDEGWVYATTSADGQSILSAGRIESCMGCHEHNTQDRLFGPRWAWPVDPADGHRVTPARESPARSGDQKAPPADQK